MRCSECGSDVPEDSTYCLGCGSRLTSDQNPGVDYADIPFGSLIACPGCGTKNLRTERWCGGCDRDLADVKLAMAGPSPRGTQCPECGTVNPEDSRYCRKCGTSLRVSPEQGVVIEPEHVHEIIREKEVIMVRCKYCGSLNGQMAEKCKSCGASL